MICVKWNGMVVVGLTHENLDLMRQNRPVVFDGSKIGLAETEVFIFAKENDAELLASMREAGMPVDG